MAISTYPGLTIRKDGVPPGGTIGQILTKISNNDFDTGWGAGGFLSATLTDSHIFVGNSSNVATDVAVSGDLTLSNTGTFTFNTVNSNVGTFGSATQSAVPTVNAKGLITAISNVTITPAASSITSGQALTRVDDTNVTLTLGGTPGTALLQATSLTLGWTGNLSVARGGSGTGTLTGLLQGNGTSAFTAITNSSTVGQVLRVTGASTYAWGALDLSDSDAITGDLPFSNLTQGSALSVLGVTGNATADFASIAAGSDHQVLRRSGTSLAFGAVNLAQSAAVTGTLDETNGGTGLNTIAQGDIIYGSASNTFSALAKDTNATRYLSNQGTSNNPSWNQVNLANGVTGDLPYANLTQIAGLSVLGVTGSSTADVAGIAGTANQILRVNGAGTALAFGSIDLAQSAAVGSTILPVANGGTAASTASGARTNLGAANIAGDTFTGLIQFSGTGHAGFKANNLTQAQRLALTASPGMVVYDTDIGDFYTRNASSWVQLHPVPAIDGTIVHNNATTSTTNNLCKFFDTGGVEIRDAGVASSTDGTFASNSDAKLPTEKAVKTYADARSDFRKPISGRYYGNADVAQFPGTVALAANFTYWAPHRCDYAFTLDKVSINISTASAGATNLLRIGIYSDVDGVPTALILDCGTVSTATTGTKNITGLAQAMSAGWFHIGVLPSDNIAVQSWGTALGHHNNSQRGVGNFGDILVIDLDLTTTYAGGLPATATITQVASADTPKTYWRL